MNLFKLGRSESRRWKLYQAKMMAKMTGEDVVIYSSNGHEKVDAETLEVEDYGVE